MRIFGRQIDILDKKFKVNKSHYILQCLMATAAVTTILVVIDSMFNEVMIAAFGATAFLVFAMPHLRTSQPRSVLGGYVIGTAVGIAMYFAANYVFSTIGYSWTFSIMGGIAVGLSLLFMTMTNTEHPPAAGLALGLVLQGYSTASILIIFISVVAIMVIKHLLRNWLINLY